MAVQSKGGNETLRVFLLLAEGLGECSDSTNDSDSHECKRDDGPDDTPALRRSSVFLGEHASIRTVDFAEDEIVALYSLLVDVIKSQQSVNIQYPTRYREKT